MTFHFRRLSTDEYAVSSGPKGAILELGKVRRKVTRYNIAPRPITAIFWIAFATDSHVLSRDYVDGTSEAEQFRTRRDAVRALVVAQMERKEEG